MKMTSNHYFTPFNAVLGYFSGINMYLVTEMVLFYQEKIIKTESYGGPTLVWVGPQSPLNGSF